MLVDGKIAWVVCFAVHYFHKYFLILARFYPFMEKLRYEGEVPQF